MVLHICPTIEISTSDERVCYSLLARSRPLVWEVDVLNGVTIRGDPLLLICPTPVLTQDGLK